MVPPLAPSTYAMLVSQTMNEPAAMLVFQTIPVVVEVSLSFMPMNLHR